MHTRTQRRVIAAITYTAMTLATAAAVLTLAASPAGAVVLQDGATDEGVLIAADWVAIIIGAAIPLVNGLVLRPENPAWVKAVVANGVAIVAHAISQAVQDDGSAFLSGDWFGDLFVTLLAMTAAYLGVWKPIVNPNATLPTVIPANSRRVV